MSTQTDEPGSTDFAQPAPTPEQIAQGVVDLLSEVGEAFASDQWAILDTGHEHSTWLLYGGAALRHCCNLLYEIEVASAADLELSVRMLGRAYLTRHMHEELVDGLQRLWERELTQGVEAWGAPRAADSP